MPDQEQDVVYKHTKVYKEGDIIFRENSLGNEMFIILKGRVKITKKVKDIVKNLALLKEGDFFGEMAIIENKPRSATATVLETASLLILDEQAFDRYVQSSPAIARKIFKVLSERLRDTDRQIEILLPLDINLRVANALKFIVDKYGKQKENYIVIDMPFDLQSFSEQVGLAEPETQKIIQRLERTQVLRFVDGKMFVESKESLGHVYRILGGTK